MLGDYGLENLEVTSISLTSNCRVRAALLVSARARRSKQGNGLLTRKTGKRMPGVGRRRRSGTAAPRRLARDWRRLAAKPVCPACRRSRSRSRGRRRRPRCRWHCRRRPCRYRRPRHRPQSRRSTGRRSIFRAGPVLGAARARARGPKWQAERDANAILKEATKHI